MKTPLIRTDFGIIVASLLTNLFLFEANAEIKKPTQKMEPPQITMSQHMYGLPTNPKNAGRNSDFLRMAKVNGKTYIGQSPKSRDTTSRTFRYGDTNPKTIR